MVKSPVHGMVLASLFAALMAIGANITSIVPIMVIGNIPITLQTVVCILAGLLLGKKWGPIAMVIYALIGLAGMPVFAQWSGGIRVFVSPTFGFILSYIATAWVAGVITEKKKTYPILLTAAVIGTVVNYVLGTSWLYAAYKIWLSAPEGFSYWMAWLWMLPFVPKDLILAVVAALVSQKVLQAFPQTRTKKPFVENRKAI
ncbi:biotin transporter BioY [Jeotgalibacillus proteolyticus]|uniref:Biotin transporter n=1 Tax=Jeotgalibacillus proteolyticus TaxID=2082395 RepID=A0A2S5GBA4_9BACL|nr:biotin transporter BioY [Jeotgalibacillus proteolyticus]PPA70201.1 BioY family transporter [Jeotgalibacillus proteolyticus]